MKLILKELKRFMPAIIGILLLTIVQSIASLSIPALLAKIINEGISNDNGTTIVNMSFIIKQGLFMIGLACLSFFVVLISTKLNAKVMSGYGASLRKMIYHKVINLSMAEYGKFSTATLLTRTTNDVSKISNAVMMVLKFGTLAPLMFVIAIIMAVKASPQASKILLIALPLFVIILALFLKVGYPLFKQVQKKVDKITLILRENLTGARVVRAFNNQDKETVKYETANKDVTRVMYKVSIIMSMLMPITMVILNLSTLGVIYMTANSVNKGLADYTIMGNMMSVTQYIMIILYNFIMFCIVFVNIPSASVSVNRINEIMNTVNSVIDTDNPQEVDLSNGIELTFNEVSYSYFGAEKETLSNISFSAKQGETIAIIGGTGSGKSTLINLLPRFFDATKGQITINNTNIKDMSISNLRSLIGYVPQKAILFNDTIENNIKFGKADATREQVEEICRISQAENFVIEKENGYEEMLDQAGKNLSGGQKQRLCIARALIKKAPIYIFDDSFSALDYLTDKKLRQAMQPLVADSIIFLVAQRIGSIVNADKIIVLNEGIIVGMGKHNELMNNCEVYREIALSQVTEEELANE